MEKKQGRTGSAGIGVSGDIAQMAISSVGARERRPHLDISALWCDRSEDEGSYGSLGFLWP